jgi:hypothetical protein
MLPPGKPGIPAISSRETNGLLADIQDGGGEGIAAVNPAVPFYERGRTGNLIKIKGHFC